MPDFLFTAIGVLTPIAVLGAFFVVLRRSAHLLSQEVGRTPIYKDRTGARFGLTNFTTPFVRVAVYEDLVVLSAYEPVLLTPSDIVSATIQGRFLSRGVRIAHCNPQLPDPLIVWSSEPAVLAAAINRIHGQASQATAHASSQPRSPEAPPSPSPSAG